MVKLVELVQSYRIGSENREIKLSVEIGNEQIGGSSVAVDGVRLNKPNDVISEFPLGSSEDLKDSVVKVKTIVMDTNRSTNRTTVTYTLQGGITEEVFTTRGAVENDNDPIVHELTLSFASV